MPSVHGGYAIAGVMQCVVNAAAKMLSISRAGSFQMIECPDM
ncbi:MAG: hypothetical protein RM049_27820 [Nostoc sp. DedQUE04]|nr:hypothetical protein [Nostoc sp. DedQUE04]MDZ8139044.1 hypothetical protein [Nostoc sp. DedQUE04]